MHMNAKPFIKTCLLAVVLTAMAAADDANAQTNLQAQIVARPLSPGDIVTYGLPANSEVSGGLFNCPLGEPLYLEAEVSSNFPASNIVSVTWAITNKPAGSTAALQPSPLGTNVPIYEPSDRLAYYVAGRTLLRPDITGSPILAEHYTVVTTITTTTGTTNLAQNITAGTYVGVNTCTLCHSGGQAAPDMVQPWSLTEGEQPLQPELHPMSHGRVRHERAGGQWGVRRRGGATWLGFSGRAEHQQLGEHANQLSCAGQSGQYPM
jgi:hypothetical protein